MVVTWMTAPMSTKINLKQLCEAFLKKNVIISESEIKIIQDSSVDQVNSEV